MSTTTGAATIDRPGPRAAREVTAARHVQVGDIVKYEATEYDHRSGTVLVDRVEVDLDAVMVWGTYTTANDFTGQAESSWGLGEFHPDERVRVISAV